MDVNTKVKEQHVFSEYLKSKGLSHTKPRQLILEEVFRNHEHFEAEDIVDALKKRNLRVSRATVYRTLTYLEECDLIRKVDLGHSHLHYEHTLGHNHHEHLYCVKCGKIIEVTDTILENRIGTIADHYNFAVSYHGVQIFGICKLCQVKSTKSSGKKNNEK